MLSDWGVPIVSRKSRQVSILTRLEGWQAACAWALVVTVGLRLVLGLAMALAWIAAKPYLTPDQLNDPAVYGKLEVPTSFPADALLGVWLRWDAIHHLNLALRGYFDLSVGDSVFYPFYAILARGFSELLGGNIILAGLVVSTLASFLSFAGLYRLADTFYGPETARWSVLALAAYPTALFLVAPFTESLFLALTLGAFMASYRQRWWLAGLLGFFASLTRGPGMLTTLPLLLIAFQQWRKTKPPLSGKWVISVAAGLVLPIAGSLAFIVWRDTAGFPSMTETLRQYSGLVLTDPFSALIAGVQQWLRVRDFPTTLELLSACLFIVLTGVMLIRPQCRKPEWLVYAAVNLILFLSKQSLIASSLQSLPRYVLILFPIFILIGGWLASQGRLVRFIYLTCSSAILLVFSVLYVLWVFMG